MSGKRYPEEFKIEAVKQVIDRGHSVSSIATSLDVTTHSLYVWTAAEHQLQKLYVPDPQSDGYCIFLVFWFGGECKKEMPLRPLRSKRPGTASEMELWLNEDLAPEDSYRIKCFVIDVSDIV